MLKRPRAIEPFGPINSQDQKKAQLAFEIIENCEEKKRLL